MGDGRVAIAVADVTGRGYGPAQQVVLDPGDILVLMTDGFIEWEDAFEEQFGLERLSETIRQAATLPSREIISALHAAVLEFANGTPQADDLTAVIIKRECTGS